MAKLGNGPTQATEIQDTAPVAAPSQEAEDITASPAVEHTEVGATDFDTTEDLLAVISEKTGYETDELELDFELEADLGIDTVKQAEIFAELREKYGLERDDTFNFADYPTIEALIGASTRADAASGTPTDTPDRHAAPDTSEVVDVDDSLPQPTTRPRPTEAAESTHAEEPVPQPQGEAALPFKGTLPDPFRKDASFSYISQSNPTSPDGLREYPARVPSLTPSKKTERTKGAFSKPFDCVIDLGVETSFHEAQNMADRRNSGLPSHVWVGSSPPSHGSECSPIALLLALPKP